MADSSEKIEWKQNRMNPSEVRMKLNHSSGKPIEFYLEEEIINHIFQHRHENIEMLLKLYGKSTGRPFTVDFSGLRFIKPVPPLLKEKLTFAKQKESGSDDRSADPEKIGAYSFFNPNSKNWVGRHGWSDSQEWFDIIREITEDTFLIVFIQPKEAEQSGAKWRINGGQWRNSGSILPVSAGNYTLKFKETNGWITPKKKEIHIIEGINENVRVDYAAKQSMLLKYGKSVVLGVMSALILFAGVFNYMHAPGSMREIAAESSPLPPVSNERSIAIRIDPPEAIQAGARWKIEGPGTWRSSGERVSGLIDIPYTIVFKSLPGWKKPLNEEIAIEGPGHIEKERIYTEISNAGGEPSEDITILRFQGSNTIGAKLAPDLAEAFLKVMGASSVQRITLRPNTEIRVKGSFPDKHAVQSIEIKAHGSSFGFEGLADGQCDIAMASRRADDREISRLSSLGNMADAACEHVLAIDGVAVIANPANASIEKLNTDLLSDIFSGRVGNWRQINGRTAPINVHARDMHSGTHELFKEIVLGANDIDPHARQWDSNEQLSDAVAEDPDAIGYCGLPYAGRNKILAISDRGHGRALLPSQLSIATEDYPLTRRLYLYTPADPDNIHTRNFIAFALGKGQEWVARNHFVPVTVSAAEYDIGPSGKAQNPKILNAYLTAVKGAKRVLTNYRFRTAEFDLDTRAVRDLERVADFIAHNDISEITLAGFADNQGDYAKNLDLSCKRAQKVQEEFHARGIETNKLLCVGEEVPIASNQTAPGQARNRRVEVWVR